MEEKKKRNEEVNICECWCPLRSARVGEKEREGGSEYVNM
jgi:hypothetical protein